MNSSISIFLLCFIVFIILTFVLFSLVTALVKSFSLNIKSGAVDNELREEYEYILKKTNNKKFNSKNILNKILSWLLVAIMILFISYFLATKNQKVGPIPVLKTVESPSMATKHKDNTYLNENNLNNQISTNDLIILYEMPDINDIQLYDIVAYKSEKGYIILHRIIEIKEENGEKVFKFRGDANNASDSGYVKYDQMLGIYKDKHIPIVGNFVKFLRSPAGLMCILLIILVVLIYPSVNKKILILKRERLIEMGLIDESNVIYKQK